MIGALALFVTAGAVNAQSTKFGVKGGLNLAGVTNNNGEISTDRMPTFHAGVVADLGITEMFSVRTGLDLQGKGYKYTMLGKEYKSNPLYLEIPVNFTVNFPLGAATKLYAGAGPYVAFGVGGKYPQIDGSKENIKFTKDQTLTTYIPGREYKPLDAGANVVGGLTFNEKFGINLQYGIGLINTVPEGANDSKANKHGVFGVGGVFYF